MVRMQLFLMMVYVVCFNEVYGNVVITAINNIDIKGRFVFLVGSRGSLVCSTNPCQGQVHWMVDSEEVAQCTSSLCTPLQTRSGIYSFGFNTGNCTFEFAFNPVTRDLRDNTIECKDGETSANVTLEVQEVHAEDAVFGDQSQIWHGLGVTAFIVVVIGIFFAFALVRKQIYRCIKLWHEEKTERNNERVKEYHDDVENGQAIRDIGEPDKE